MGKLNKDNKGFGVVELVIVILVFATLCVAGWFVYRHYYKITKVTTNTSNIISQSPGYIDRVTGSGTESTDTLKISQLNIKLVNIPASLSKLEYQSFKATCDTCGLGVGAGFTTSNLLAMDSSCTDTIESTAIGFISEFSAKFSGEPTPGIFIKQIDNIWLYYAGPQSFCGPDNGTSTSKAIINKQTTLASDLQNYLSNPANIQKD
jgi:hypothetical protein